MSIPSLKNYLPVLTLTCGYPNRVNLPQEIDEASSREIEGVTSVTYGDFPEGNYYNIRRPACRAVATAIVDFKQFNDRTLSTVFQQRKEVAVAVMKHALTRMYNSGTDSSSESGSQRYTEYSRHGIPIHDELKADLEETEKRLFTRLPALEQKFISDSQEMFGITLEPESATVQNSASSSSALPIDIELDEKLAIARQNKLEPLLTQVYQTAANVIGAAEEGSAKPLAGRVLTYCTDIEQELVGAKKRAWADRFYWIMLQFTPRHGNPDTTKREVTVWGAGGSNRTACTEEGEKLLATGEPTDFYLKFGNEKEGVHKAFLQKALINREWTFEGNFFTRQLAFAQREGQILDGIDITCYMPEPGQEKQLVAAIKEYLYTGKVTCDSDLVPALFIVSKYLGFESLQKGLARQMFGIEQFQPQIEQAIAAMDAVVNEPAEPLPVTLDDLATRVGNVMHGRIQRLLSIAGPVENLLNLLTPFRSYNDNNNSPIHY